MALDGFKGRAPKRSAPAVTTLWQLEIESPDVELRLACYPTEVKTSATICRKNNASASTPANYVIGCQDQSARDEAQEVIINRAMKGEHFTEDNQDDELGSAMTEDSFNSSVMSVSDNGRQPKQLEAVSFKDWASRARSMEENPRGLDRMGSGTSVVSGSGGESDVFEDLRRYSVSMEQAGKLPSSKYKGVVPQPNGRWGSQIYEKHQRVWLGTFDQEEDAAIAYNRAALKFRGRDAMTNFSPVRDTDPETRFMTDHTREEIVDMLRKHTFDAEFDHHIKRITTTAARSGLEGSDLRTHVCQEIQGTIDANANVSSFSSAVVAEEMAGLRREHLFDKVLTPSDVGKLNRLVIPKQHAENYFPLDGNSSDKGLFLDFEDSSGKVWRFRYSYWNSSQSYVLTKGWSRFVKDKIFEAGDIVSFHKGFAQPDQLYISWRHKSSGQPERGYDRHHQKSKGGVMYPVKRASFLNSINSGTQAPVVCKADQWMPIFWPSSRNPNAFAQFNSESISSLVYKIGHVDAFRSQCSVAPLSGTIPSYFPAPPTKQTVQSRFNGTNSDGLQPVDLYLNLNSGDGSTMIEPRHPSVNPSRRSAAQELENPEHKAAALILDPVTKKGVRVFGVTLAEPQRLSAQHHGQLNLFP